MSNNNFPNEESKAQRIQNLTYGHEERASETGDDITVVYKPNSVKELYKIVNGLKRRTWMLCLHPQFMVDDDHFWRSYDNVEVSRASLLKQIRDRGLFRSLDGTRNDGTDYWLTVRDMGSMVFIG